MVIRPAPAFERSPMTDEKPSFRITPDLDKLREHESHRRSSPFRPRILDILTSQPPRRYFTGLYETPGALLSAIPEALSQVYETRDDLQKILLAQLASAMTEIYGKRPAGPLPPELETRGLDYPAFLQQIERAKRWLLSRAATADPKAHRPFPEKPSGSQFSPRELSKYYGVPYDRLRKRLGRLRDSKKDPESFVEIQNPSENEPCYLYRLTPCVLAAIQGLWKQCYSSNPRPPHDKDL